MKKRSSVRGFTLVELLVVIAIIGSCWPASACCTASARSSASHELFEQHASARHCVAQLRIDLQAVAIQQGWNGTYPGNIWSINGADNNNQDCLSGFPSLLPYMEQQPLYNQIYNGFVMVGGDRNGQAALLAVSTWITWNGSYSPWRVNVATLRCPSAQARTQLKSSG